VTIGAGGKKDKRAPWGRQVTMNDTGARANLRKNDQTRAQGRVLGYLITIKNVEKRFDDFLTKRQVQAPKNGLFDKDPKKKHYNLKNWQWGKRCHYSREKSRAAEHVQQPWSGMGVVTHPCGQDGRHS